MTRRLPRLAALAVAAAMAAACGGTPQLNDPNEILVAAVEATEGANSVRVEIALSGSVPIDLDGSGGVPFELDGTVLRADLDMDNGRARLSFDLPALFGLSGELIARDEKAWLKTSLTGALYMEMDAGDLGDFGDLPLDPGDIDEEAGLDDLREFLSRPELAPEKLADVACGSGTCYQVRVALTGDQLADLGETMPGGLPEELEGGSVTMTVRTDKATNRLDGLDLTLGSPTEGTITLQITFSDWNGAFTIDAPSADQIGSGDLFDFFGP